MVCMVRVLVQTVDIRMLIERASNEQREQRIDTDNFLDRLKLFNAVGWRSKTAKCGLQIYIFTLENNLERGKLKQIG